MQFEIHSEYNGGFWSYEIWCGFIPRGVDRVGMNALLLCDIDGYQSLLHLYLREQYLPYFWTYSMDPDGNYDTARGSLNPALGMRSHFEK